MADGINKPGAGRCVITYGTFDLLHYGHVRLLQRAKALGDYLIVALSVDDFCREKGKNCIYPYEQRKEILEAIKYVDLVIPESSWDQKQSDIEKYHADLFVMGSDWEGYFDHLDCIYLPRTENVSTSIIKQKRIRRGQYHKTEGHHPQGKAKNQDL